jgi:hypothetical protein
LEYCPHCQRWVEPTKGNTDILAGAALGGWLGGVAGAGHYLLKGSRCPICNNVIVSHGAQSRFAPQTQAYPQQAYQQYYQPTYPWYYQQMPQYSNPAPRSAYPRVTSAVPVPPSAHCGYCRQPLVYVPHLQRWYCEYCRKPVYP